MNFLRLMFVLFLTLIVFACNETSLNNNKVDNKIKYAKNRILAECNPIDSLGIIHNEFLNFHFNRMLPHDSAHYTLCRISYNGQYYLTKRYFDTMMTSLRLFGVYKGCNPASVDSSINRLILLYQNANMFTNINGTDVVLDFKSKAIDVLNSSLNLGYIAQIEYNIYYPIALSYHNSNYTICDSLITNINLCNYQFDSIPHIFASKSIWVHSKDFWETYFHDSTNIALKDNKIPIINLSETDYNNLLDSFGGMLGAYIGGAPTYGIGAIIGGGIGSFVLSELGCAIADYFRCPVCGKVHLTDG